MTKHPEPFVVVCRTHGWGIGTTTTPEGELLSYGVPVTDDPRCFTPDTDCCTPQEIEKWRADLAAQEPRR